MRRLARELGVDLGRVSGSKAAKAALSSRTWSFVKGVMQNPALLAPTAAPAAGSGVRPGPAAVAEGGLRQVWPDRNQALSRIQKISGANLRATG